MTTASPSDEVVRTRAYLLWEADGRPFGRDDHYWGLASAELSDAPAKVSVKKKATSANAAAVSPATKAKPAAKTAPTAKKADTPKKK
jgi:hypothetical protein